MANSLKQCQEFLIKCAVFPLSSSSLLLKKAIGMSAPRTSCWRTAPITLAKAFIVKTVGELGTGWTRKARSVSLPFTVWNEDLGPGQVPFVSFRRSLRGVRNCLGFLMVVGHGRSSLARIFCGRGKMSALPTLSEESHRMDIKHLCSLHCLLHSSNGCHWVVMVICGLHIEDLLSHHIAGEGQSQGQ